MSSRPTARSSTSTPTSTTKTTSTATAAEATGCRVRRLGAPRIPVGYAPVLEAQSRIGAADIVGAVRALLK